MKKVKEYLNEVLDKNSNVVVACSGGPDSMCLLHLVLELKDKKNLNVICAHVNHKMRIESENEAKFVREYCENNNAIFEYYEINEYTDDNFHNQARIKRYDFFKDLVSKYDAKYLLTAHHGDDLIETILMRIVRGSNLKGYLGFKKESDYGAYKLIRPMITVTKKDIHEYNQLNNIKYVTDASNEKNKYTRNRYRHEILPFLKTEEKDVHKKFLKFSKELSQFDEFLVNYMSNLLTTIIKNDTLNISLFLNLDDFIKRKVIEKMIEKIQEDDLFVVEDKHIDLILNLINSDKANAKLELPNKFVAIKNYNELKIIKRQDVENFCIKLKAKTKLNRGNIQIIEDSNNTSNFIIRLNSSELVLPLYVRNRKNGDKMAIKNLNGTKKIKDIFIDSKIPMAKRETYPIVVDKNDTILWLPGLKKSKFDKELTDEYDIILKYEEEKDEYKK